MLISLCAGRAAFASICALRCSLHPNLAVAEHAEQVQDGPPGERRWVRRASSNSRKEFQPLFVVVLFVREYICKPLAAVWVCELVPYYAPRGWRIQCVWSTVYPAWEKKYKSKTKQLQKTESVLHKLSTNSLVIKIDAQRSLVHIISNFSVFR